MLLSSDACGLTWPPALSLITGEGAEIIERENVRNLGLGSGQDAATPRSNTPRSSPRCPRCLDVHLRGATGKAPALGSKSWLGEHAGAERGRRRLRRVLFSCRPAVRCPVTGCSSAASSGHSCTRTRDGKGKQGATRSCTRTASF
jgi:hypothetical protein